MALVSCLSVFFVKVNAFGFSCDPVLARKEEDLRVNYRKRDIVVFIRIS